MSKVQSKPSDPKKIWKSKWDKQEESSPAPFSRGLN